MTTILETRNEKGELVFSKELTTIEPPTKEQMMEAVLEQAIFGNNACNPPATR